MLIRPPALALTKKRFATDLRCPKMRHLIRFENDSPKKGVRAMQNAAASIARDAICYTCANVAAHTNIFDQARLGILSGGVKHDLRGPSGR